MPDWIIVVILGIVEGITEFIPVSSTGHLLIAEKLLHVEKSDLFNIVIQCGAVIAVLPLFPQRIYKFVFELRERETQSYLLKLFTAFVITCIGGFIIDKKGIKLPEQLAPVAWALLIGGIAFVIIEFFLRGKKLSNEVTWTIAIAVGLGQLVAAVFPGSSRSGTTIMFSLLLGLSRPAATEFSFLVGIPTMLAAGGLKIFKAMHHAPLDAPHENWGMILLATAIAAIVSFIAVKWLLRYVQSHTFTAFGWYRIALAVAIFLFLLR
ncbi:MAG TPA: undecaprenyl-diphosphate phosphatase [Verrucomicrobiae bacterium]|jgi:undecaprenyl-diphosphatase